VGEKSLDGNGWGIFVRLCDIEPGEMFGDRIIESKQTTVAKLEDADTREQFGNRTNAVNGSRRCRDFPLEIGVSESTTPDELLIINDAHGDPRDPLVRQLGVYPYFQEVQGRGYARVVSQILSLE